MPIIKKLCNIQIVLTTIINIGYSMNQFTNLNDIQNMPTISFEDVLQEIRTTLYNNNCCFTEIHFPYTPDNSTIYEDKIAPYKVYINNTLSKQYNVFYKGSSVQMNQDKWTLYDYCYKGLNLVPVVVQDYNPNNNENKGISSQDK